MKKETETETATATPAVGCSELLGGVHPASKWLMFKFFLKPGNRGLKFEYLRLHFCLLRGHFLLAEARFVKNVAYFLLQCIDFIRLLQGRVFFHSFDFDDYDLPATNYYSNDDFVPPNVQSSGTAMAAGPQMQ